MAFAAIPAVLSGITFFLFDAYLLSACFGIVSGVLAVFMGESRLNSELEIIICLILRFTVFSDLPYLLGFGYAAAIAVLLQWLGVIIIMVYVYLSGKKKVD